MKEKNKLAARLFLVALALIASSVSLNAQWLWPIAGGKTGGNMVLVPQQYIDNEHNFDNVIITASEGTSVVAPCDGEIIHLSHDSTPQGVCEGERSVTALSQATVLQRIRGRIRA